MIVIGGKGYELMLDHKDGWNPEAFRGRYSEVLDRYDYIIGDWGYSQLRLKGFYRDNHPKVNRDTAISGMVDYINEYCNFGCAYFVLHKLKEAPQEGTFKDILIKEIPEPGTDEDLEQEDAEAGVSVKEHREPQTKAGNRDRDTAGGSKDRPVREHQSRNHRNKDGQGKKNHKEFQGRGQQGSQGNSNSSKQNREHRENKSNRPNKQENPNNQNNPAKQDNPNISAKQDNQNKNNNNNNQG
ncbi:YutD family protein [Paenibacillus tritici]|uniref:YutD family protein n=1 Tax=Paenibacillus tritici TaxID=1873425 RepID=A0ABX2DLZ6_9BACL|nr:YutD family protein [Paenibacillus tritici]NQX45654.1 YutD family protein [Paenibacillus tritici]